MLFFFFFFLSLFEGHASASSTPAVFLDTKKLTFNVAPTIEKGVTYIEFRSLCTSLGYKVQWNQSNKEATCLGNNERLAYSFNTSFYIHNGIVHPLQAKPLMIKNRTMIPMRETAQLLNYQVIWLGTTKDIILMNSGASLDIKSRIAEQFLDRLEQTKQFNGVALVAKDNDLLFADGYGFADQQAGRMNTPDTKFAIASITKGLTGISILQLEEQNKLKLTDTVDRFYPHLPYAKQVTIQQLLTHTAGFPWEKTGDFKDIKLIYQPGTSQRYSNAGYMLLGKIIEKVSGLPYEQYVNKNIFSVIDMEHSGFDIASTSLASRARGYNIQHNRLVEVTRDFSLRGASGGLYSSAEDLYRLDQALHTEQLLSKETTNKMLRPHYGSWGYGWQVFPTSSGLITQLAGSTTGFTSYIRRNEAQGNTLILLSNHANRNLGSIGRDIERIVN